jgi:carbon monoxide dehydrogenase subunit G
MKLEQNFTVPVPVEQAWEVLLDLHRVAPCMPGATLTSVEGDEFTGNVKVKLGPIMLTYNGKGRFVERDEAARRVVIEASGRDTRSAGTAAATVTARLVGDGPETRVDVLTDLSITGKPAQFGRSMISDVSTKLLGQFADCLAGKLAEADAPAGGAVGGGAPAGADTAGAADSGAAAESGAGTTGAAVPAKSASAAPTATVEAPAEAEAVDLFKVVGSTAAARRAAVVGLGAALLAVLAWVVVRVFRR